jgi:hypothetical protein
MTPEQKIKQLILNLQARWSGETAPDVNAENIDEVFDAANEDWALQDSINEIRCSGIETGLKCDWSRHYESEAVAMQAVDGSWVGWTYWFGGGKHGEPEAMPWMEHAYDVDCAEEVKVVTVRTFTKPAA